MITNTETERIRKALRDRTIGIVGDFCIDVYWDADMTLSELSRETPEYPLPVISERIYPGAGGNVAANLAALSPKKVAALYLCGKDWRGTELKRLVRSLGISDRYVIESDDTVTNAYCKPMKRGISGAVYEAPRLDFENRTPLPKELEAQVCEKLAELIEESDCVVCADQFRYGIVTPAVRRMLCDAAAKGKTVVCDSRFNIASFPGCILKPNETECLRAVKGDLADAQASVAEVTRCAAVLSESSGSTVFCTLGAEGSVIADGGRLTRVEAIKRDGPLDICGAGDASLAAFACALASGTDYATAARFAAAASAVTVKKIGVTGTASFDEIADLIRSVSA